MNIMKNVIYGLVGLFNLFYYVIHSYFMKKWKRYFSKIFYGNFPFSHKIWNKISNDEKNLVKKLLEINP